MLIITFGISIENKEQEDISVHRKWTYIKNGISTKMTEIMHPKTGGGKAKTLNVVEQQIHDFLQSMKMCKIDGIPEGIDTLVRFVQQFSFDRWDSNYDNIALNFVSLQYNVFNMQVCCTIIYFVGWITFAECVT